MRDYDWIQIAYIFDTEPSYDTYKSFFREVERYLKISDEFNSIGLDLECEEKKSSCGEIAEEAAQLATEEPSFRVKISTEWDNVTASFDKDGLGFPKYELTPYLTFTTWIYALKDTDIKEHQEKVEEYRNNFAKIHQFAANIFDPKWGFGRRGGLAIGDDETVEELADRTRPPLHEYNVFREETVEAIGREQVLSAPAYYVEELDSGGVFMAVTEPPKQCGHEDQPCEEVAEQLGLSLAKTKRYH
ncbi:hypothetical protein [Halorhabdus salina]|uniref:hypothetical protein n=1 Tax=Halorhabdus salina TaxID=2750670 RepID=UPI00215DC399|nr:hypothetical protein [Halorhabdus salina]